MKGTLLFSAALMAATLITGCSKDDKYSTTGGNNSNSQPQMAYQVKAVNAFNSMQRTTANGTIVWTSGFANPSVIKFEAKQNNSKLEYEAKNTGQIDLFAFDPMTFGNFTLGPGTYNEIELKIMFKKNGSSPAIQLNGQFTNNVMSVPVTLIIDGPLEIKTEQEDVVIDNNTSYIAITDLDLGYFTSDISENMWENADLTNGTLIISENSNENLYNRIVDRI
jgi:hypothetical protein